MKFYIYDTLYKSPNLRVFMCPANIVDVAKALLDYEVDYFKDTKRNPFKDSEENPQDLYLFDGLEFEIKEDNFESLISYTKFEIREYGSDRVLSPKEFFHTLISEADDHDLQDIQNAFFDFFDE